MQGLWMNGWFLLPFLGWNTITDLRWRRISLQSLLFFGLPALLIPLSERFRTVFFGSTEDGLLLLCGVLPGAFLLLLSFLSDGAIGRGDGLVCMILGCYLGIWHVLLLLMGAFVLGGLFGTVLLLAKKADKKTSLPLLPFLLFAYVPLMVLFL